MTIHFYDTAEEGVESDKWALYTGEYEMCVYSDAISYAGSKSIYSNTTDNIFCTSGTITVPTKVTWYMYDDNVQTNDRQDLMKAGHPDNNGMGVHHGQSTTNYVCRHNSGWAIASVARSVGWHKFQFVQDGSDIKYYIDDNLVYTDVSQTLGDTIDFQQYSSGARVTAFDNIVASNSEEEPPGEGGAGIHGEISTPRNIVSSRSTVSSRSLASGRTV